MQDFIRLDDVALLRFLFPLRGKVVYLTGGASGIGYRTALLFARMGAKVVIFDFNREDGARAAQAITEATKDHGGSATYVWLNVANSELCVELVKLQAATHGAPDILFCSAGKVVPDDKSKDRNADARMLVEVNLLGTYYMCEAVLPFMLSRRSGNIILMGSAGGDLAVANRSIYCMTKAAVHNLAKSLATTHGPMGIRVNAIAPARVLTELVQGWVRGADDPATAFVKGCATQASGTMLEPEEVAFLALMLCSPLAAHMNGQVVGCDDAWTAGFQGDWRVLVDNPSFQTYRAGVESATGLDLTPKP